MTSVSYETRRDEIETYFDRTAADAWAALTSDAPVSRIRRTVRRGRDAMRETLLSWLPEDLTGSTLIDAGCGTGVLAIEAAQRGAEVVAVDLSPTLVNLARERFRQLDQDLDVTFLVGDMREMDLGSFDYAVAMDSLIHYDVADGVQTLQAMAEQIQRKMVFTFAPKTPLLALMHATGRLFPRGDRAPSIEPVSP
jgi:magnesium-protoporphyrin O-methyltransferase